MLRPPVLRAVLVLLLAAPLAAFGQNAQPAQPLNWVPKGFEVLGQRAAFHTDFTFDRSMLQVASYFIGDADPGARDRQVERYLGAQLSLCRARSL
jgi:hypothetical protein